MRRRVLATLVFWALATAAVAWTHGTPVAVLTANIQSCSSPCTGFGATCDGVANDSSAFDAFNSWAITNQGSGPYTQVQLTINNGATCTTPSVATTCPAGGACPFTGIRNLVVSGYGASWSIGNVVSLVTNGNFTDGTHSSRFATAMAGDTCVTLTTPAQASRYVVGSYAEPAGFDYQGGGDPPNNFYYEYVKVLSSNTGTGQVCFTTALTKTYLDTWPVITSATGGKAGGPATLYALAPDWDATVVIKGLAITKNAGINQYGAAGRDVTFLDASDPGPGTSCFVPGSQQTLHLTNYTATSCQVEMDKSISQVVMTGGTINEIKVQSGSPDVLTLTGSATITARLLGTPKKLVCDHSSIGTLIPGPTDQGRTDEITMNVCNVGTFNSFAAPLEKGGLGDPGVNHATGWSMSGGVITIPNAFFGSNPDTLRFAVPGTNITWSGDQHSETLGQVTTVTQDATNIYVGTTGLGSTFPTDPSMLAGGTKLFIQVHPAPKFTCTGCTGAVAYLNNATPGAPLYSYGEATVDGSQGGAAAFVWREIWGNVGTISLNVSQAYTGAGALTYSLNQFHNTPVVNSANVVVSYNGSSGPLINTKSPTSGSGVRSITLAGVTGTQTGDLGLAVPDATQTWLTGSIGAGIFSADVSGACPGPAVGCPTIVMSITTNQGVVNP